MHEKMVCDTVIASHGLYEISKMVDVYSTLIAPHDLYEASKMVTVCTMERIVSSNFGAKTAKEGRIIYEIVKDFLKLTENKRSGYPNLCWHFQNIITILNVNSESDIGKRIYRYLTLHYKNKGLLKQGSYTGIRHTLPPISE